MKFSKLLLLIFLLSSVTTLANELTPWTLRISSAKEEKNYRVTQAMTLNSLMKTIYPVDNYDVKKSQIDKSEKVKVTYIGKVSGIKVYDFIYSIGDKNYLKTIVLERQPGRYIPVYYCFIDKRYLNDSLDTINNSFIIANKNLIVSQLPLWGSGGNSNDVYLYIPPDILQNIKKTPHFVNMKILFDILSRKIPEGYYTPAAHAFNIKTLHFHSCVTTAAHCFNSEKEGVVDMQFKLHNGELKLVDFIYKNPK